MEQRLQRIGHRAEAVGQLMAQREQLVDAGGAGDAAVHVDLRLLVADVARGHVGVEADVEANGFDLVLRVITLDAAHRADGLVDHLQVQLEAECGDVAGLLVAEEVAGAAQLEVAHRDLQAGAQVGVVGERGEPLRRRLGELAGTRVRACTRTRGRYCGQRGRGSGGS